MQRFDIQQFLSMALTEDVGAGDITSDLVVPPQSTARFVFRARQSLVVAGLEIIPLIFGMIDERTRVNLDAEDGAKLDAGAKLATIEGPARALLMGERVALNLLQHLSGVATLTRTYVDAVAGTSARISDTRKTIPGLRALQKYAVKAGGGQNHRMGLDDGILIKDNHLVLAGGITAAVTAAKSQASLLMRVEVECDTLAQVDEAIMAGADIILLDNMDINTLKEAVTRAKAKNIATEASGNVTFDTVRPIAETGVDVISIGRLTHSAPAVDIGLDRE